MSSLSEYKTVQARILVYTQEMGWSFVPRGEAKRWRGSDPNLQPANRAIKSTLFFDNVGGNHFPIMEVGDPLTLKPIILLYRRAQSRDGDSSGHRVFE
jgi:hypothetical protein